MRYFILLILLSSIGLVAFSPASHKPSAKYAQKMLESFCSYVPSGKSLIGQDTVSVQAFYISSTEITNAMYDEFLRDLKQKGELEKYRIALYDSSGWTTDYAYNEPYRQYYHSHPAYRQYPVVNVTREGAELFCNWLSGKYEEMSNGELHLRFRLPTRAEWIRAASGGLHYSTYAWGGPYLRNAKGCYLANFLAVGAENITRNPETGALEVSKDRFPSHLIAANDHTDVLAPAKSYFPNDFGLYNMNGNAAELIADGDYAVGGDWRSPGYDIRNESIKPFDKPDPTVGFRVVATVIEKTP